MTRSQNWPDLLTRFLEERRSQSFCWGVNDCCLFAADWLKLATGNDFASEMRGNYRSALGAARLLIKHGGVYGLASSHAGLKRIEKQFARRGDIIAHEVKHGAALGICIGAQGAFVGEKGLVFPSITKTVACWTF